MVKLTKHISMTEATHSDTAKRTLINNTPDDEQLANMIKVAENVFEPLREHFGVPVGITSFFRSKALNAYLKGSKTSQHVTGEAIDIDADIYGRITNSQIFLYILLNLEFDQLIWEFGDDNNPDWVHVSYREGKNRKQVIRTKKTLVDGGNVIKYIKITK